ncbi:MAG: permease [Candidatus Marinimicrobia bacterium]|nr:permease [Candidatus Neomarinimicrobiota bacterium]
MIFLQDYLQETGRLLSEMAPYLLLGFLIAGILKYSFRPGRLRYYLGGANLRSVLYASLLGVPMPLCSCGVIPTGVSLYRNGASKGAAQSFLISTPQTGVDSIMVTYSLLGLPFAVIRPIAAFITGIFGGAATNIVEGEKPHEYADRPEEAYPQGWKKISAMLKYAYIDFMADIAKWLAIGILVAALISVLLPEDFFLQHLSNPYLSMLIMLAVSVPLYVCATGSVPIAAALLMKGLSPGAALVFLMAGPATNAATISVIGNTLGKRSLIVYLSTIILGAFAGGVILEEVLPASWFGVILTDGHQHRMLPEWLKIASAVILVILIIYTLVNKMIKKIQGKHSDNDSCDIPVKKKSNEYFVEIEGMSCRHCVMSVKKGLSSLDGVTGVDVNLEVGMPE